MELPFVSQRIAIFGKQTVADTCCVRPQETRPSKGYYEKMETVDDPKLDKRPQKPDGCQNPARQARPSSSAEVSVLYGVAVNDLPKTKQFPHKVQFWCAQCLAKVGGYGGSGGKSNNKNLTCRQLRALVCPEEPNPHQRRATAAAAF